MLLGDYFTNIFKLAGVDPNSEEAKALLTNTAVSGYDLPDAVINQVNGALLTVESAKNNPALKNHFTALALNGIDDEINAAIPTLGLTADAIEELKGVSSTYKRVTALAEKAKAVAAAAAPGNNPEASKQLETLNSEIARLNGEIQAANDAKNAALTEQQAQFNNQLTDMSMSSILGGYDYASPASKEANLLTAKTLLNQALTQNKLSVVRDQAGNLSLKTAENTDYYENNAPVAVKDYAERILGEHKLLKINNTPPAAGAQPVPGAQPVQTTVTPTAGVNNSAASVADQLLNEALGQ